MGRVMVIGLDGATFNLILPWADAGRLPHFAALRQRGSCAFLDPPANVRSASSWTSFMTGQNPGKHGIFEFYDFDPRSYSIRFIQGGERAEPTVWRLLSEAGKQVIVLNVPMTYPAEVVNGILIAGLDAPGPKSKGACFPPDIISTLEQRFGPYILEPGLTGFLVGGKISEAVSCLEAELTQKVNITKHLMTTHPWDLFVIVFRSLDAVQHCFWKYMDPSHPDFHPEEEALYGEIILHAYQKVDSLLGELLTLLPPEDHLLIVSDHGFGPKHPATNQLNAWLANKGYLHYSPPTGTQTALTSLLGRLYRSVVGQTSRETKEALVRRLPSLRNRIQSRLCFAGIDWQHTQAYSDTLFASLRINLRGREGEGIVEEKDYEKVVEQLRQDLLQCRDSESGEPIVAEVLRREEIYHGPYVPRAPDLTIRWREDIVIRGIGLEEQQRAEMSLPRAVPFIPGESYQVISGDHRRYGIFLAAGQKIKAGFFAPPLKMEDVAPLILHLFALPVPADMDGEVRTDILTAQTAAQYPPRYKERGRTQATETGGGYTAEEGKEIEQRLRDLGYLE